MPDPTLAVSILAAVAWPVTVLILLLIFRRSITSMTGAIQRVEGPGGVTIFLDTEKVRQVIEKGRQEQISEAEIAQRIVAEVLNTEQLRILRALFDEPDGRLIENYVRTYRKALDSLIKRGYVHKTNGRFALTAKGVQETGRYLHDVLARGGAPETS
jgi:hypothetical protein